jgi:hypothetical protein
MLTLKKAQDLNWSDLPYIESPLMAKRTVQSNHGTRIGGDPIINGAEHGLPDNRSKTFDSYGAINDKLDNGQVFLINNRTQMPVVSSLEISEDNRAKWQLNSGQNLMFLNAIDAAMHRVPVPSHYSVVRDEPAQSNSEQAAPQKAVREKHIFLLNLEGQNDRPLPEKHNITLVVENTTQSNIAVRQLKEVIYDNFSRVFSAEQGDGFKVYAITDSMLEVRKDLNENKNLAASVANNAITELEETGTETRADGVILHNMTYVVPVPLMLKVRYEYAVHGRSPSSDVLVLVHEDSEWKQAIYIAKQPKQVINKEDGWLTVLFENLPEKGKFSLYQQNQNTHSAPMTLFNDLEYANIVKNDVIEEMAMVDLAPMNTDDADLVTQAKSWDDWLDSEWPAS